MPPPADRAAPRLAQAVLCDHAALVATLLGFALAILVARPARGQITTNTALPVHEGEWILREQFRFLRASDDPGPGNRVLEGQALATVLVHGATPKLALFGVFPYVARELRVDTAQGRRTRRTAGLADMKLFARYTLAQWDRPRETRRVAPFLGLEAPTGRDDARDSLGRLPRPLQLGSGSWDPFAGATFTWQTLHWQMDASGSYTRNTRAGGFRFGDLARLDFSFQVRLLPLDLATTRATRVPGFFYGVLESNLLWQGRNQVSGVSDGNSGGWTGYLVPGVQYVFRRFILEAAVQLPVLQERNGLALEDDWIATMGFRVSV